MVIFQLYWFIVFFCDTLLVRPPNGFIPFQKRFSDGFDVIYDRESAHRVLFWKLFGFSVPFMRLTACRTRSVELDADSLKSRLGMFSPRSRVKVRFITSIVQNGRHQPWGPCRSRDPLIPPGTSLQHHVSDADLFLCPHDLILLLRLC